MVPDGSRVHVIGAGLAGLACAVALAETGQAVRLYEAAGQAGGRARSFYDATFDRVIDNGNHLLLSGNRSVFRFLDRIGTRDRLVGPPSTRYPFLDLTTGEHWVVRIGAGLWPGWVLDPTRRVPGTRAHDYLSGLKLARARPDATVSDVLGGAGALYARFWHPLAVSALNTEAERAQARLLWPVLLETFGRGGRACRPLWARDGLSETFVTPALDWLARNGAPTVFGRRLKALDCTDGRVTRLVFPDDTVDVPPGDQVVLAVPPWTANLLIPDLRVPTQFRPIVNLHFRLPTPPARVAQPLGLLGGTAEWLFVRGDVASVTISAASPIVDLPPETIAEPVWPEVARALGLPPETPMPPFKVIKEKRATFAQTPEQVVRRPGPRAPRHNVVLAGDWTDTGLPATIEGAVRSGHRAAETVTALQRTS
ncbi:NAD(P)-binding protein [Roseospira marina]|uniref:NAD(P)-binding protein n=1 Tax=Roseospira marina TaxID=140057 RepID=A0A5M6IE00_9PROT|nr:hydroxysqualene dehydroxylase HpnE [Roseospira marina]KAA5606514.1 NAD(P)-binding protein [Roseospira marina]MBB4314063.1 squalene-associated FAD-dependent desaturase [Roseospira marina]MBB5087224.1 squalene-associated FAD-dependent desaturase [Roseospira marina]